MLNVLNTNHGIISLHTDFQNCYFLEQITHLENNGRECCDHWINVLMMCCLVLSTPTPAQLFLGIGISKLASSEISLFTFLGLLYPNPVVGLCYYRTKHG